jgi:hypothetical protein
LKGSWLALKSYMRDLPANFSIVSDTEFQSLQYLPDFELRGEVLCRVNDAEERFIMSQSTYDKLRQITEEVEAEVERVGSADTIEITEPISPSPVPKHDNGVPDADKQAAIKLGLGENQPLPNHPESSRRPELVQRWLRSVWWEIVMLHYRVIV